MFSRIFGRSTQPNERELDDLSEQETTNSFHHQLVVNRLREILRGQSTESTNPNIPSAIVIGGRSNLPYEDDDDSDGVFEEYTSSRFTFADDEYLQYQSDLARQQNSRICSSLIFFMLFVLVLRIQQDKYIKSHHQPNHPSFKDEYTSPVKLNFIEDVTFYEELNNYKLLSITPEFQWEYTQGNMPSNNYTIKNNCVYQSNRPIDRLPWKSNTVIDSISNSFISVLGTDKSIYVYSPNTFSIKFNLILPSRLAFARTTYSSAQSNSINLNKSILIINDKLLSSSMIHIVSRGVTYIVFIRDVDVPLFSPVKKSISELFNDLFKEKDDHHTPSSHHHTTWKLRAGDVYIRENTGYRRIRTSLIPPETNKELDKC